MQNLLAVTPGFQTNLICFYLNLNLPPLPSPDGKQA